MQQASEVELTPEQAAAADVGLKFLVPVRGRPFLDWVLDEVAAAGFEDACLVVSPDSPLRRRDGPPSRHRAPGPDRPAPDLDRERRRDRGRHRRRRRALPSRPRSRPGPAQPAPPAARRDRLEERRLQGDHGALRRREPAGRTVTLWLAVLNLFVLPFGTALGIYAFWVLLHNDNRALFLGPRNRLGSRRLPVALPGVAAAQSATVTVKVTAPGWACRWSGPDSWLGSSSC
mgnify:CR=1 FL=1